MNIDRPLLQSAAQQGLIDAGQADALWAFFEAQAAHTPSFRFTHVLYYLGGLLAIGAMTLFMTLGWERFGGFGLLAIALAYAALGLWLTQRLLVRHRLPIPAGVCAAFVVALAPLAVYGLQAGLGMWADGRVYRQLHTHIDWRWLLMELATLAAGAAMAWRYRLPFLLMPVAVTLWYLSMDLTPFLFGSEDASWELRKLVSLWFGLLMLLLAFWIDLRTQQAKDYAFWIYLFGMLAFWGGLSTMRSESELGRFTYLCINLVLIVLGSVLGRRVFTVCGGLGVAGYLGHLAYTVFKDSMIFPFALTAIGLGIVYLGIVWQRREAHITRALRARLPAPLQALLARRT